MKTFEAPYSHYLTYITIVSGLLLSSCMQIQYSFVSPGMVKQKELTEHNAAFRSVCQMLSRDARSDFEVIGHGAGSWRYYPMGINKKGIVYGNGYAYKKTPALDIIDLIDTSIDIDPDMSIELDAHYAPKGHLITEVYPSDGAYILHDIPDWNKITSTDSHVLAYLHRNTIRNTLKHFTQKEYYTKSKIYIEIKVNKACFHAKKEDSQCNTQYHKLANELQPFASQYTRKDKENWLCITSFSPGALTAFREALPPEIRNQVDYVLILGYTGGWPKSWLAQSKGFVPRFDPSIESFAVETSWLNCIWFSAQGIKDFNKRFNELTKRRIEIYPDFSELEFSFSTYQKKQKKMTKRMTKAPLLQVHMRSFMLDLDYPIAPEWQLTN